MASRNHIAVSFVSESPQAAFHDWLALLNLTEPQLWEATGIVPDTIKVEVTSRYDDALVERLAKAMFDKTMYERALAQRDLRRSDEREDAAAWEEAHPQVRQGWLDAARAIVDGGGVVNPETGEPDG